MKKIAAFFYLFALLAISFSINMLKPLHAKIIDGKRYYLGKVGVGQAFNVIIERQEKQGGIFGKGGYYDYAYAFSLPDGWKQVPSKLYGNPLQVIIKVADNAKEGQYKIGIAVVDENNAEKLGIKRFFIDVDVTRDIMNASLVSNKAKAGVGQPVTYTLNIKNKADVGDIFVVEGISRDNYFYREVYIPPKSERDVKVLFSYPNVGIYEGKIHVYLKESSALSKEFKVSSKISSNFFNDFISLTNGFIMFYSINALPYKLLSIISSLF